MGFFGLARISRSSLEPVKGNFPLPLWQRYNAYLRSISTAVKFVTEAYQLDD